MNGIKKSILVTAIGSFSADIVIKNLHKNGYNVIGCDIYQKEWLADSENVDKFYKAPYASAEDDYINFIKDLCLRENINYIFPLTDVEIDVFNVNRTWFELNNIQICISSKDTIDLCRDKMKMADFLKDKCADIINVIPTYTIFSRNEIQNRVPLICKPKDGRSSQGITYIKSNDDWNVLLNKKDAENYIVQPFIPGNIVTVDVVRQNDEMCIAIPRRELLRTLNGAGTSVYVFNDEKLEHDCVSLANMLNIVGCVNFEFIENEQGEYYFIECNPRFSGGVEFSCIAGYDCITNHLRVFTNMDIDKRPEYRNQYIARKYEEFVTCIE